MASSRWLPPSDTYTAYASTAKSRCSIEFSPSTSAECLWKDSISAMLIFVWKQRRTEIRDINAGCVIDSAGFISQTLNNRKNIPKFRKTVKMFIFGASYRSRDTGLHDSRDSRMAESFRRITTVHWRKIAGKTFFRGVFADDRCAGARFKHTAQGLPE